MPVSPGPSPNIKKRTPVPGNNSMMVVAHSNGTACRIIGRTKIRPKTEARVAAVFRVRNAKPIVSKILVAYTNAIWPTLSISCSEKSVAEGRSP